MELVVRQFLTSTMISLLQQHKFQFYKNIKNNINMTNPTIVQVHNIVLQAHNATLKILHTVTTLHAYFDAKKSDQIQIK